MARSVRKWAAGVGLAGGAAVAAAMIGVAGTPAARADTPDDVIGQAITDLNEGGAVLATADTADLGTEQLHILTAEESIPTNADPPLTQLDALQDELPASDQTYLAGADEQLVTAAQNLISGDEAFVAADQAGQLTGGGFLPADLPPLEDAFGLFSAEFHSLGATFVAAFDPDIGTDSAAAASATTATTGDEVLTQASSDLTQASSVLEAAPTASLDSADLQLLESQESFLPTGPEEFLTQVEAFQADLPAADQTSPLLLAADQQLLQGAEGLLSADQAFVAADQAGELTAQTAAEAPGIAAESGFVDGIWGLIPGTLDVGATDIVAQLAADIGLSF